MELDIVAANSKGKLYNNTEDILENLKPTLPVSWEPTPEPYVPYLYSEPNFIRYQSVSGNREFSAALMKNLVNYTGLNYEGRLYYRFMQLLHRKTKLQSQPVSVIRDISEYIERTLFFNFPDSSSHIPDFLLTGNITKDQMKLDRILYNNRYLTSKKNNVYLQNPYIYAIDPYLRSSDGTIIAEYVNTNLVSVDDEQPLNISNFYDVASISIEMNPDFSKQGISENIKSIMENKDVFSIRRDIIDDQKNSTDDDTIVVQEQLTYVNEPPSTTARAPQYSKPTLPFKTSEELADLESAAYLRALQETCSNIKPRQEYFIEYSATSAFINLTNKQKIEDFELMEKANNNRKTHPKEFDRKPKTLFKSRAFVLGDNIAEASTGKNITEIVSGDQYTEGNVINSLDITTAKKYNLTEQQISITIKTAEEHDDQSTEDDKELFKKLVTTNIIHELFTSAPMYTDLLNSSIDEHQVIKKPGVLIPSVDVDITESSGSSEEVNILTPFIPSQVGFAERLTRTINESSNRSNDTGSDSSEALRAIVEAVEITSDVVKAVENFRNHSKENSSILKTHNQIVASEGSLELGETGMGNALVQNAEEVNFFTVTRIAIGVSGIVVSIAVLLGIGWTFTRIRQIEHNLY